MPKTHCDKLRKCQVLELLFLLILRLWFICEMTLLRERDRSAWNISAEQAALNFKLTCTLKKIRGEWNCFFLRETLPISVPGEIVNSWAELWEKWIYWFPEEKGSIWPTCQLLIQILGYFTFTLMGEKLDIAYWRLKHFGLALTGQIFANSATIQWDQPIYSVLNQLAVFPDRLLALVGPHLIFHCFGLKFPLSLIWKRCSKFSFRGHLWAQPFPVFRQRSQSVD